MELYNLFLFFNLGGPEIFFIMLAILLLFGAKKIPELARGLGRGIREFKDATSEVKEQLEEGIKDDDDEPKRKKTKVKS